MCECITRLPDMQAHMGASQTIAINVYPLGLYTEVLIIQYFNHSIYI